MPCLAFLTVSGLLFHIIAVPLLPEPVGNRLPVCCQVQPAFIVKVIFYSWNIIFHIKVPHMLLRINFTATFLGFFLAQKTFGHFVREHKHNTGLFYAKHFPEHREPPESLVYYSGKPCLFLFLHVKFLPEHFHEIVDFRIILFLHLQYLVLQFSFFVLRFETSFCKLQ